MLSIADVQDILIGYGITEIDEVLLSHSLILSKDRILNEIAQDEMPEELIEFWKRLVISDYLNTMQGLNRLEDVALSEVAIKAITEGDTRVEYSDSLSASDKMNLFIRHLIRDLNLKELYSFRKMRW